MIITARQQEILTFVRDGFRRGRSPTIREIGARFGISSPHGVANHLNALVRKGLLVNDGNSRGYRPAAMPDLAEALHALVLALEGTSGAGAAVLAELHGTAYADAVIALRDAGKFSDSEADGRLRTAGEVVR